MLRGREGPRRARSLPAPCVPSTDGHRPRERTCARYERFSERQTLVQAVTSPRYALLGAVGVRSRIRQAKATPRPARRRPIRSTPSHTRNPAPARRTNGSASRSTWRALIAPTLSISGLASPPALVRYDSSNLANDPGCGNPGRPLFPGHACSAPPRLWLHDISLCPRRQLRKIRRTPLRNLGLRELGLAHRWL